MTAAKNANFNKLSEIAEILKAVAHPLRIQVIYMLSEQERMTVTEIYKGLQVEQSLASHHLSKMRDKGVLKSTREGKNIYYQLADEQLTGLIDCIEKCNIV